MKLVMPCNNNNAIKIATFALEFGKPIDKNVVKQFITACENDTYISKHFPQHEKHRSMNFDAATGDSSQWVSGASFNRLTEKAELDWGFAVSPETFIVSCGSYTRWDEVFSEAMYLFKTVLNLFAVNQSAVVVALEYVDEFIIPNDSDTSWKSELFNINSNYLPRNVYDIDDSWHSHHGFFVDNESQDVDKMLNNIELTYVKGECSKGVNGIVQVLTSHKSRLLNPLELDQALIDSVVSEIIEASHLCNKEIMRDFLSDLMCNEINLEAK